MKDKYIYGAGSNYDWTREFVVKPMLNGEVRLQPAPKNTYELRPETSSLTSRLKTAGLLGALFVGAGFLLTQVNKKPR
jgi:hypothetical protein